MSEPGKLVYAEDELERWAQRFAHEYYTAWETSDDSEYMDFWDWLDLTDPTILDEFKKWFLENRKDD